MTFDPGNLGTPVLLAFYITWKEVIPALARRKNGNGNGVYPKAETCKAAGALGSMPSEVFAAQLGTAVGKEISAPMAQVKDSVDRNSAALEKHNSNMTELLTTLRVDREYRRRE